MQQEIKVRELAEQFFKEEINKLDDPQRKEEVEHEKETYIGVWMLGFRAGEQQSAATAVWVKARIRYPEKNDKYFIKLDDVKSAANLWQSTKEYWQSTDMEWLDESSTEQPVDKNRNDDEL